MDADESRANPRISGLRFSPLVLAVTAALAFSVVPQAALQAAEAVAQAVRDGDLAEVQNLLASGAAVNAAEGDGSTALLWAAYQSDPEIVAMLIDAGADVNAPNRLGVTPLLQAARTGDAPVIRELLDGGAELEAAILNGETALMAAARTGRIPAVSLLLEAGSDPNAAEVYQGQTALMWAAAEGHADVVGLLLDAGADPDAQARVSSLIERSSRTDFPSGGFSAAMFAAREGFENVLQRLFDAGADFSLQNGDGATAMMIAVINDRFDLVARMLDIGIPADDGALYHAVLMRDATTDWLAKDGSRWRADYANELTALDLIGRLLEAGADPNAQFFGQMHSSSMCCDTTESGTPFYRAAIAADVAALELLIEYGADVEWTPTELQDAPRGANGNVGKQPLVAAMNGGKGVGMAGGPGDIRENQDPPFREAANRKPADAVRVLLGAGADPNRPTANDSTMVHDAARARDLDMIRTLAEHGAALDALNGAGLTALDVAEGRRGESSGGERRGGPGPGFFGGMGGNDDKPSNEQVAALLRELMESGGIAIIEHGSASDDAAVAEEDG